MGEIIPRPIPPTPLPFTGERLTSEGPGQTEIEHLHRYLLAREYCRGKDVLDVASGEGYGTALLGQVARTVTGVEIAAEAVDHARTAYARDGISFIQADARAIPLASATFDVVVSFETLEHFAEQASFLQEVRRVLRPGGLLVLSSPDRDNYSPAETAANPFHVRELTGAELEALLRSHFSEVSVLLQRPVFGSVLLPAAASAAPPLCFERRGAAHFEASTGLARPQYLVAFASDAAARPLPPSVYIETGRLGMLAPQDAEARLAAADQALAAERARSCEESATRLRELQRLHQDQSHELASKCGEVQGLVAANEMAERACAALRAELQSATDALQRQQMACSVAEARASQLEAELHHAREHAARHEGALATTLASHSWRVTAPLRTISRIVSRSG